MFSLLRKENCLTIFKFEEATLINLCFLKLYLVCKLHTVSCNSCSDAFLILETSPDIEAMLTVISLNSDTSVPELVHVP